MDRHRTSCQNPADLKNNSEMRSLDEDFEDAYTDANRVFENETVAMNDEEFMDEGEVEDDGQFENDEGSEVGLQQPNKLKRSREGERHAEHSQKKLKQTHRSIKTKKNASSIRSLMTQVSPLYNAYKVLY